MDNIKKYTKSSQSIGLNNRKKKISLTNQADSQTSLELTVEEKSKTTKHELVNNNSNTFTEQMLNFVMREGNNLEDYNYITPLDRQDIAQQVEYSDIIFPDNCMDGSILKSFNDFEEIFCFGNYSNKILVLTEEGIEIINTKLSLENVNKVLFVLNEAAVKKVGNHEYFLDDLQYDIAKAIGTEPKKLKLLYLPTLLSSDCKKDYTNVQLTKMLKPLISKTNQVAPEKSLKCIEIDVKDLIGEERSVIVTVHNLTYGSQWLGGYWNFKDNIYYHNAMTQTDPKKRHEDWPIGTNPPVLYSRNTQTHLPSKDVGINLPKDRSTQMWRTDHYINSDTDLIVVPRLYESYKDPTRIKERAAAMIQKVWKHYKSRKLDISGKFFNFLKQTKMRESILAHYFTDPGEGEREYLNAGLLNLIFPYTREHFDHLHWLLAKFHKDSDSKQLSLFSAAHKASSYLCLEKKFEVFLAIERRKVLNKYDNLRKERKTFFEYSSVPTCKPNFDKDSLYLLDTSNTQQFRKFKELYILFKRENLSSEQRIEVLLLLKQLLNSFRNFEMKDDLISLLDRECLMLSNGMDPRLFSYLRKREEEILVYHLKSLLHKKVSHKEDLSFILRCKACRKFKNVSEYNFYLGKLQAATCKSCTNSYLAARIPKSFSPYCKILKEIREDEYRRGCCNPYISLLQPKCIEYIIQNIWGGKSIFTHISTPSLLKLPRWNNEEPWAPWNCILLTKDETQLHENIDDVKSFYGEQYCQIIKYRHLMALQQFRSLIKLENMFRNVWNSLPDNVYSHDKNILQKSFADINNSF